MTPSNTNGTNNIGIGISDPNAKLDVNTIQAAMLEKIEELTLYVIELQEQIDVLEDRMKGAEV